jgi:hypothetical protein
LFPAILQKTTSRGAILPYGAVLYIQKSLYKEFGVLTLCKANKKTCGSESLPQVFDPV